MLIAVIVFIIFIMIIIIITIIIIMVAISINMTVGGLTNQLNRPQNLGSTPFQLSINLNIQVAKNLFHCAFENSSTNDCYQNHIEVIACTKNDHYF